MEDQMKQLVLAAALLLFSIPAAAQVVVSATSSTEFTSPTHNLAIPAGSANAGEPQVTSYQAYVFPLAADVTTGMPIVNGLVVPKSQAVATGVTMPCAPGAATTCPVFKLTFAQLGFTIGSGPNQIPPCTATTQAGCPQYSALLIAIGPGGNSAKGVLSESDPFTLSALAPAPPPAPPSQVKIKG
jgi:hypothetical protein